MIIDSHTHIGTIQYSVGKNKVSNLPGQDLLVALSKYSIDYALVSSIEGAEFNSEMRLALPEQQVSQLQSIEKLVEFVKKNEKKLRALLWVKPYTEICSSELENFVAANLRYIAGLKMHPSLSGLKFIDNKFVPYIKLAQKYQLPIQVHSENDGKSDVKFIYEVAKEFKDIDFTMVHMGLNTDNSEAIDIIKKNENIYGDISLVSKANVIKAIEKCGSHKILFGTDAIVNGIDTYEKHLPIIKSIKTKFRKEDRGRVFYRNCVKIYNLNIISNSSDE
jgi:uncharacterized protein